MVVFNVVRDVDLSVLTVSVFALVALSVVDHSGSSAVVVDNSGSFQ